MVGSWPSDGLTRALWKGGNISRMDHKATWIYGIYLSIPHICPLHHFIIKWYIINCFMWAVGITTIFILKIEIAIFDMIYEPDMNTMRNLLIWVYLYRIWVGLHLTSLTQLINEMGLDLRFSNPWTRTWHDPFIILWPNYDA